MSRSFYLTLKALPKELREPISLAYLLARTADTIADTASSEKTTRKIRPTTRVTPRWRAG